MANDENTIYDGSNAEKANSEDTQFESNAGGGATPPPYVPKNEQPEAAAEATVPPVPPTHKEEPKSKTNWAVNAAAAAGGLLIGGVAPFLMGAKVPDSDPAENPDEPRPAGVDDDIKVAHSVNDSMSFNEAFAAARSEVGPGGCFEWHGNLYGTYYASEWDTMSPAQRAEFGSHFDWNHIDSSHSNVHHAQATAHATAQEPGNDVPGANDDPAHLHAQGGEGGDDINVVRVNDPGRQQPAEPTGGGGEGEVQVLGVVHDAETGQNIGAMTIDGEQVFVVDVDNDLVFDAMLSDQNHDGDITPDEVQDIQGLNLTVADVGGFQDGYDPSMDPNAGTPGGDDLLADSGETQTAYEANRSMDVDIMDVDPADNSDVDPTGEYIDGLPQQPAPGVEDIYSDPAIGMNDADHLAAADDNIDILDV